MNTSSLLNRLSFALSAWALLLCGCNEHPELPEPATLDELEKATCLLYGGDAQAVLVGFNDRADERIFLLTARHVATYKDAPKNQLDCNVCRCHKIVFKDTDDRWLTTEDDYDLAWFELNENEIAELQTANALTYIALTNGPNTVANKGIAGTGAKGYEEIIKDQKTSASKVALFYRSKRLDGEAENRLYKGPFNGDYNIHLKVATNIFVRAMAPETTIHGESGGAVFTEVTYFRRKFWMLSGLITGGMAAKPYNCAISPIDKAIDDMRCSFRKLADHKELW